MFARLRNTHQSRWAEDVDQIRAALGAPYNPTLFPPHFLKATFPEIGGKLIEFFDERAVVAYGFLFPRAIEGGRRVYTLRFHAVPGQPVVAGRHIEMLASAVLPEADIVLYDPAGPVEMPGTVLVEGDLEIGRPDVVEAEELRRLQARIWGSNSDLLYPSDIHSLGFGAGTSLIARYEGKVVGFLFGFVRFGGASLPAAWANGYRTELRLESQVLGTDPDVRGRGIGGRLKQAQAMAARELGIDLVSWTVDPLQLPNAMLNIGTLGAVSGEFFPNWYSFQNELNQVPASRLGMTWVINSERAISQPRAQRIIDIGQRADVVRLNDGAHSVIDLRAVAPGATVAIEIPRDWTTLQSLDYETAWFWRQTTDRLLSALLGAGDVRDRYMITAVGRDGDRTFLIAEPAAQMSQRMEPSSRQPVPAALVN
jgi:predicted GNAT superfamily acetyltransferase